MGRTSKYNTVIAPNLDKIEDWIKQGATDKEVCEKLKISTHTFTGYLDEARNGREEYIPLLETYTRARVIPDEKVVAALFKLATGYTWIERVHEEIESPDGKITHKYRERNVEVPPSFPAQQFWLTNKCSNDWKIRREVERVEDSGEYGVVMMPEVKDE